MADRHHHPHPLPGTGHAVDGQRLYADLFFNVLPMLIVSGGATLFAQSLGKGDKAETYGMTKTARAAMELYGEFLLSDTLKPWCRHFSACDASVTRRCYNAAVNRKQPRPTRHAEGGYHHDE